MNTIPQAFAMHENGFQRKDNPLIPRSVIREALVNAITHKDYFYISPIQVIKYANRIEFRNLGYSLKPIDQIGLPGSVTRNVILPKVFSNINFCEAKGTGMGSMRDTMRRANLSVPLIESNRAGNLFVLTLLTHQLFTRESLIWLDKFKHLNLSEEDARTPLIIRDKGALTNHDYRFIHCTDTLNASANLRKLRKLGLIEQQGSGSATYYIPTLKLVDPDVDQFALFDTSINEAIPQELQAEIRSLRKKTSADQIRIIVKKICAIRPFRASEIAILLNRNVRHLRNRILTPMVQIGELTLAFPDNSVHPMQTYKTKD